MKRNETIIGVCGCKTELLNRKLFLKILMKKQILSLALAATMIGTVATSCSSAKKTGESDSTSMTTDTSKKMDTAKMMDTTKKDTSKKM